MIKKIIACADIHIRNVRRNEEYQKKLQEFIDKCKEIADGYKNDEVRIVIAGDIFHNKTDISPEAYLTCSWFLKSLGEIAKTIVIAGNHDISPNTNRLDPLTTVSSIAEMENVFYLDRVLDYESGCLLDDNVVWCLYSSFDNFNRPNIDEFKITNSEATYVGLFHGTLANSTTDTGYSSETGLDPSLFDGVNFGIVGHIHKRQCISHNGVKLVYCGSLIQQDFGENLSNHGFVIWDVGDETYEEVNFNDDEYGFYNFKIDSIDDIEQDKEEIINL